MNRHLWLAGLLCLIPAGLVWAQQPGDKKNVAVVELLEDETAFFLEHLDNHGASDASVVDRSEQGALSGNSALTVTAFQRFNTRLPGWKYIIAEDPGPGQYRYLRFAWKRTEGPGIMLQIHAQPNAWHRYYAGTLSEQTQSWGAMTRVADAVPQQWQVVTRDLFTDFGPMTITGIGFSALEGPGLAYYDHTYLGRTIEDLDRVTAAKKNDLNEPAPAPPAEAPARTPWLFWAIVAVVFASLALFLGVGIFLFLRGSAPEAPEPAKPAVKPSKSRSKPPEA
jgi:hypothetical protein